MLPPIEWVKSISVSTVHPHHDAGHVDTVGSEYYSEVETCNRSRQVDDDCVRPVPGRDNGGEAHWRGLQGEWTCQQNFVKHNWHLYYKVIMDAARHVRDSSSPYQRHTYRYSPRSVGRGGGPCWRCPPRGWSRPRSSPSPSTTCTDTTSWNTPTSTTSLGRIRVSLLWAAIAALSYKSWCPSVRLFVRSSAHPWFQNS